MTDCKKSVSFGEISRKWIVKTAHHFVDSLHMISMEKKALYFFGSGYYHKRKLTMFLDAEKGFKRIPFSLSTKGIWLERILFFIPSPFWFLIKINDIEIIDRLLLGFDGPYHVDIFLFDKKFETAFLEQAKKNIESISNLERTICRDSGFLILSIDDDEMVKELISGPNLPKELSWLAK